jgi:isopropylmalate/homocitrate/citramalate synthase
MSEKVAIFDTTLRDGEQAVAAMRISLAATRSLHENRIVEIDVGR